MNANDKSWSNETIALFDKLEAQIRQQQAEIEKLRSWVEMLIEVPFFEEIDHYRGIPIAILKKDQEK